MKDPHDTQVGGDHYTKYTIQPVDFITENNLGFIEGCIIKYICRYQDKNGLEDLDKAIHYIELLKQSYNTRTKRVMNLLLVKAKEINPDAYIEYQLERNCGEEGEKGYGCWIETPGISVENYDYCLRSWLEDALCSESDVQYIVHCNEDNGITLDRKVTAAPIITLGKPPKEEAPIAGTPEKGQEEESI